MVGMSYSFVSRLTNFIMTGGPIAMTRSIFTPSETSFLMASVTRPFVPYEPSSVVMITSSLAARIFCSMITRSFVRPPRIEMTLLPAAFIACAIGCDGAMPMPPPTMTTVPYFSICVGRPRGPARSGMFPPGSRRDRSAVVLPTACTTSSIHPASASPSAIVSGIRSPDSLARSMMNWPAFLLRAIAGASTFMRKTCGVRNSFSSILFMSFYQCPD